MKKVTIFLFLFCIGNVSVYSQYVETKKYLQDLRNLIKETAQLVKVTDENNNIYITIGDEFLTKQTFETLLKNNALKEKGSIIDYTAFKTKYSGVLFRGNLKIKIKLVWYNNVNLISEIDFINYEDKNIKPDIVSGYFNCKNALGEWLLKALSDVKINWDPHTPSKTKNHNPLVVDIKLSLTYSKIRLYNWSDMSENSPNSGSFTRNQYTFSFFNKTGCDAINLPFWFRSSSAVGIEFIANNGVDLKSPNDIDDTWKVYVGYDKPIYGMHTAVNTNTSSTFFKKMKLFSMGDNLLLGGELNTDNYHISAEASINIQEKNKEYFSIDGITDFNAIKNYVTFSVVKNKLSLFNAGISVSWFSTGKYTVLTDTEKPKKILNKMGHGVLAPEVGLKIKNRLFDFSFGTQYNFCFSNGISPYHYIVFKTNIMFNDFIGFDVKYFRTLTDKNTLPEWHYEDYLIFSPVLKIAF